MAADPTQAMITRPVLGAGFAGVRWRLCSSIAGCSGQQRRVLRGRRIYVKRSTRRHGGLRTQFTGENRERRGEFARKRRLRALASAYKPLRKRALQWHGTAGGRRCRDCDSAGCRRRARSGRARDSAASSQRHQALTGRGQSRSARHRRWPISAGFGVENTITAI